MTPQDFKNYRKKQKYSISKMAELIGVSMSCYYGYECREKKLRSTTRKKFEDFNQKYIAKPVILNGQIIKSTIIQPLEEKVFLDTEEDLTSALNEGCEVIHSLSGDVLKMVNGFLVRYRGGCPVFINGALDFKDSYFMFKPIPLKIETGKKYIARDGRVATIFAKNSNNKFSGVINGDPFVFEYDESGECVNSENSNDKLIKEGA